MKKETGIGVFLWVLRIFSEHLHKTPPSDCFWQLSDQLVKESIGQLLPISGPGTSHKIKQSYWKFMDFFGSCLLLILANLGLKILSML